MSDLITFATDPAATFTPYSMRPDAPLHTGRWLWQDARAQLLSLLADAPAGPEDAWHDYWHSRAPQSPLSRRAKAQSLFTQHMQASAQVAHGLGEIQSAALQPLLALLEGRTTHNDQSIYVETVNLLLADGTLLALPGTLLVTFDSVAPVAQLLYRYAQATPLQLFTDSAHLQDHLLAQRYVLWPTLSQLPDARATLDYQIADSGLSQACEQWLKHCWTALADMNTADRQAVVFAPLADAAPLELTDDSNNDFISFGSLSADISQGVRWASLDAQHRAIQTLLGDAPRTLENPVFKQLDTDIKSLARLQVEAAQAATQLLAAQTLSDLYRLRDLPNVHYATLYRTRSAGLATETKLQSSLGQLPQALHEVVQALLANPVAAHRTDGEVVAAMLTLSTTHTHGIARTTSSEELPGVTVLAYKKALLPGSRDPVLLYWPGRGGGLQVFESVATLRRQLLLLPDSETHVELTLTPLSGDWLDYGLQTQLHACEERASELIRTLPAATHASERAEQLQALVRQTAEQLHVPTHEARDRAFAQILEQEYATSLALNLPGWLTALENTTKQRLGSLINAYITASRLCQQQLARDLPTPERFAEALLQARLQADFALDQDVAVNLRIPDHLVQTKEPVAGSGAPGTPSRIVTVASKQWRTWTLAELAQHNIDNPMLQRLGFMQLELSDGTANGRAKLLAGIDLAWLRKTVPALDIAQHYEDKIRDAFMGSAKQPPFTRQYQRECLIEPIRLMLKMQGEYARLQGQISTEALQNLQQVIDAADAGAFAPQGKELQLLPARLQVGGNDTGQLPTTLSGVTFIHERISGQTLVYLPDSPDHRCLREYASLEKARVGLFDLCIDQKMLDYLAGRALKGDYEHHRARIKEALARDFTALISLGGAWPATTSLANHLLDAHMGRLVEAYRLRGRSNDALYLEQAAIAHGNVFNYIRMALGVLPFVGTALALHDTWTAANATIQALSKGDLGEAMDQFEAALLGLVDALIDTVPGAAAKPGSVRKRAFARHLPANTPATAVSPPKAVSVPGADPFAGYHYTRALDLSSIRPATYGRYRNVYRHAEGDFIVRHGQPYRAQWDNGLNTWRLAGSRSKTYQQPITQDMDGTWQTHGALSGHLIDGGLAGGGGVIGYLGHRAADGLQPLWPEAIRARLPRWLADGRHRRHMELSYGIDTQNKALRDQLGQHMSLIADYASQPADRARAEAACASDIAAAKRLFLQLEEHAHYVSRDFLRRNRAFRNEVVEIIAKRLVHRAGFSRVKAAELSNGLNTEIRPGTLFELPLQQMRRHRRERTLLIKELDDLEASLHESREWANRITIGTDRNRLINMLDGIDASEIEIARASNLTQLVHKSANIAHLDEVFHLLDTSLQRTRFSHALGSHFDLVTAQASTSQRRQVLESAKRVYQEYTRELRTWVRNRPERFELDNFERMNQSVQRLIEHIDSTLPRLGTLPKPQRTPGQPTKRVFETDVHDFFIGTEGRAMDGEQTFTVTATGGIEQTYRKQGDRWKLEHDADAPPAPGRAHPSLAELLPDAQRWLDNTVAHELKVQGYAKPGETPANLEDLMVNHGKQLEFRARAIERNQTDHPLAKALRQRAREMRAKGRAMRIRQSMDSPTPTQGYLDYLMGEGEVDIVKVGDPRDLNAGKKGPRDFLQEYEVRDITGQPAKTLWYVHFHYDRTGARLENFAKAHIKRPDQRHLGLQWQQAQGPDAQAIWRGDVGKPIALKWFADIR